MRKFLINEHELDLYLDKIFMPPTDDECYCVMLGARRKYLTPEEQESIRLGGADMLRRVIIHRKDQVKSVVKELEGGIYLDRDGNEIPNHAFTVYITENPRSHRKAARKLIHELTDRIFEDQKFSLDSLAKTALHKSPSRKLYLDFDFDFDPSVPKDTHELMMDRTKEVLQNSHYEIVMTKNGFHVLLFIGGIDEQVKKTFYNDMKNLSLEFTGDVEVKNDAMCPLPGCAQGGSYPHMIIKDYA